MVHQPYQQHLLHQLAQGQVTLTLTDTQTAGLAAGRYVYDLNITSSVGTTTE